MRVPLEYHEIAELLPPYTPSHVIAKIADGHKVEIPRFPVELRKVWTGSEVQDWINENIIKKIQAR
jgi:hypothetical protein